ncbi:hypothetical protein NFI96_006705, partial [Prochilodus magdalenae]
SPRNTRAVIISSGETVEGDLVTLSCSSDANPPVLTYTWFKQRAATVTLLSTDQNYTITNISSQHSGLYYCSAQSRLGQHNSTPTRLDVLYPPRLPSVSEHVSDSSVTLVCVSDSNPASSYLWRRAAAAGTRSEVNRGMNECPPVYDNISALAMTSAPPRTAASDEEDELNYSSVHFTRSPPLYSKVQLPNAPKEEEVEYATVTLSKPRTVRVREREWYQLQSSDGEKHVLNTDPQYSARVSVSTEQNNCELTVRNVRVRDSGVYNFRFRTWSSKWISASSGVNLTVTGVLGRECWGVTYTPEHVCALKGSSVDLSCSYNPGGHTVTKSVWFIKEQAGAEPVDVREDEEYQGRLQYRQSFQNDCSMRITHLKESDAQTYRFSFYTDDPDGRYTGKRGVTLSVTDLKVTVSDTPWGSKKLDCSSTCTLPNNPTYIWYKNGQPVSGQYRNKLYLYDRAEYTNSYSCTVRGHEELRSPAVCRNFNFSHSLTSQIKKSPECDDLRFNYTWL